MTDLTASKPMELALMYDSADAQGTTRRRTRRRKTRQILLKVSWCSRSKGSLGIKAKRIAKRLYETFQPLRARRSHRQKW